MTSSGSQINRLDQTPNTQGHSVNRREQAGDIAPEGNGNNGTKSESGRSPDCQNSLVLCRRCGAKVSTFYFVLNDYKANGITQDVSFVCLQCYNVLNVWNSCAVKNGTAIVAKCQIEKDSDNKRRRQFRVRCEIRYSNDNVIAQTGTIEEVLTINSDPTRPLLKLIYGHAGELDQNKFESTPKGSESTSIKERDSRYQQSQGSSGRPFQLEQIPPLCPPIPDFVPSHNVGDSSLVGEESQDQVLGLTADAFEDERDSLVPTTTAAARVGLSRRQVSLLAKQGKIRAFKRGRDYLVSLADIENYARRSKSDQSDQGSAPALRASPDRSRPIKMAS